MATQELLDLLNEIEAEAEGVKSASLRECLASARVACAVDLTEAASEAMELERVSILGGTLELALGHKPAAVAAADDLADACTRAASAADAAAEKAIDPKRGLLIRAARIAAEAAAGRIKVTVAEAMCGGYGADRVAAALWSGEDRVRVAMRVARTQLDCAATL